MNKRGAYFFVLDALIAGAIFIITIMMVLSSNINNPSTTETYNLAESTMNFILNTKVKEFTHPYINKLYSEELINGEHTLFEQITELHYTGKKEETYNLTRIVLEIMLEEQYGINYSIGGQTIYNRSQEKRDKARFLLSSQKITFFTGSLTEYHDPEITEVQIWN